MREDRTQDWASEETSGGYIYSFILELFFEQAPFKYHSSSQWDIKVTKADKPSNGQRQFARKKKKRINKMIFIERHMPGGKENYRV